MTIKNVVALLLLLCAFSACGEDSVSPPGTSNQPDTTGSDLAVIDIIRDTLYQGELGWIRTNQPIDPAMMKLFVHTIEFSIDRISGDTIFFIIPHSVTTSRVRLFKVDTLAKGDFTLHVIPQYVSELDPLIWSDTSARGLPGDPVIFRGIDIPMRRGDVSVKIDGKSQPVEFVDSTIIIARLKEGSTSGQMVVTIRGIEHALTGYTVLQGGGTLLENHVYTLRLRTMEIPATGRVIARGSESFTVTAMHTNNLSAAFDAKVQHRGDSVIASEYWEDESMYATFDLRLKPRKGTTEVSGSIRYSSWRKVGIDSLGTEYTIEFNRLRWYKQGNSYFLTATGPDISQVITSLYCRETNLGSTMEFTSLTPGYFGRFEFIIQE